MEKKLVERAYEFASEVHEKGDFENHVKVVHEIALKLAKETGADEEVVALASLLHDVGRAIYGPKEHEVTGAKEAEKFLRENGASEEIIEKVKECILLHRSSKRVSDASKEAICLRVADALSHFLSIWYMLHLLFLYKKPIDWLINKLENDVLVMEEHGFTDLSESCRRIVENIRKIEEIRRAIIHESKPLSP